MIFIIENITFSNKLTEVGVTVTLFVRMKLYACRREAAPRDKSDETENQPCDQNMKTCLSGTRLWMKS